ncbi:MAG TPA: hypothetical protein VFI46_17790 [Jiangellaceae bacterium]|nr:hypothetical protein [Jiangellaceae bacterium]
MTEQRVGVPCRTLTPLIRHPKYLFGRGWRLGWPTVLWTVGAFVVLVALAWLVQIPWRDLGLTLRFVGAAGIAWWALREAESGARPHETARSWMAWLWRALVGWLRPAGRPVRVRGRVQVRG